MKLEMTKTFHLTKAEKKVLADFYWNFYYDNAIDDMCETLEALANDKPGDAPCVIEIID